MTAAGIDVCKDYLDLAVDGHQGVIRFANNRAGVARLVKRLQALGATRIAVEATGGYEEPMLEACCDAGLWIARVNPRQARALANAIGELAKTDDIDARILALMARLLADRLRPYIAPPPWQRELRDWLRRRGQVEQGPGACVPGHRPGVIARAWPLEPQADRQAYRRGSDEPRQWTGPRQAPHPGWAVTCSRGALHGHALGRTLGPGDEGALSTAACTREAGQGGSRGVHAQAARDHQCQAPRRAAGRRLGTGLSGTLQDSC